MYPLLYFLIIILISFLVIVLKLDRGILPLTKVRVRILNPELPFRSHAFSDWIRIVLNHNLFSADSLQVVLLQQALSTSEYHLSMLPPLLVKSYKTSNAKRFKPNHWKQGKYKTIYYKLPSYFGL